MQNRTTITVQNVGDQLLVNAKDAAKSFGNHLVKLTQEDVPLRVSTTASILFGSIYLLSSDDAHLATTLALLGFAGSTYKALNEYGLQNALNSAQQAYQAATRKMITLFKPYASNAQTEKAKEPTEQIESRIRKKM